MTKKESVAHIVSRFFYVRYQAIARLHLCPMNVIEQWFSDGKDFYTGVALLRRSGYDVRPFEPYLSESYVPTYYRELLESLVSKLSPQEMTEKPTFVQNFVQNSVIAAPIENETITQLRQEAKLLHKRHADRHAQLHILDTPELRLPIITEIMEDIIPALDEIYDTIRNGGVRKKLSAISCEQLAESVEFRQGIQEGFQKAQKLGYLKNRIFKLESANGLINKAKDKAERAKFETELIQKRTELAALAAELGITENE